MAASSVNDDLKVMDVSKPGKGKVVATARPVVAPVVDTPKPKADNADAGEDQKTGSSSARKIIQPLSEDFSAEESVDVSTTESADKPQDDAPDVTDAAPESVEPDTAEAPMDSASDSASVDTLAASAETKKQAAKKAQEQAKRDAELQELIDSRKYHVPIKHRGGSSGGARTVLIALIVIIIIAVAAYALADAGLIDVGVELPLDLIKESK